MNIKTKLVLAAAAVTLLSAPAAARIDGDEGGASAYPRFKYERTLADDSAVTAYAWGRSVEPRTVAPRTHRPQRTQHRR